MYNVMCVICAMSSDRSVPDLSSTMTDYQTELNRLSSFVSSQVEFEQASCENRAKNAQHPASCKEPRYVVDLDFLFNCLC